MNHLSLLAPRPHKCLPQWGVTYPLDIVKSRIQTQPDVCPRSKLGILYNARKLYAQGGARAFTVGLSTTLVRSVPTNAVTFLMYEWALEALKEMAALR